MDTCDVKTVKYNDIVSHRTHCYVEEVPCIFGCGDGVRYKGKAQHRAHALEECQAIPIDCITCLKTTTRGRWSAHECVSGLIELVDPRDGISVKTAL